MVNKREGVEPAKLIGAPMRKGSRQRRRMTSFFSSKSMNASLRLNLMGHVLQLSTIRTTNSHRVEDEISLGSFHNDYANGWGQHAVQGNHSSPLLSSQTNDFIVLNTTRKAEPTCQARPLYRNMPWEMLHNIHPFSTRGLLRTGMQSIIKQDPGRARQKSQASAESNITSHFRGFELAKFSF